MEINEILKNINNHNDFEAYNFQSKNDLYYSKYNYNFEV